MSGSKRAPSWVQVPTGITIYTTPEGWRHSIHAGGFLCGQLSLPADASDGEAKSAAVKLTQGLALEFHGVVLEIDWAAGETPHSWTGYVRQAGPQVV